jgi:hypothetical protein
LEEYNILNNYAAKHFKTLARDSAKLDATLKDLTKKLSKLTHKSAPPGSANTHNASTVQNPGPHEIYVQRLTALSGQIQQVRKEHLADYTKAQRNVDRCVARSSARCTRQNYGFLGDALIKTGGIDAIGAVNAWGVYANTGMSPPIMDLNAEGDIEVDEGEWDEDQEEDEGPFSPRQVARDQLPRPPTSFSEHSNPVGAGMGNGRYPPISINMQGKMPARTSQTNLAYPGSSQQIPPQSSQQFQQPPVPLRQTIANFRYSRRSHLVPDIHRS